MNGFVPIFRRQLSSYFFSPIAYVTMTMFLMITGLNFWRMLMQSVDEEVPAAALLFGSEVFWIMAITAITLVTMSLVAEEKCNRTIEPMLTAPITNTSFILGKYAAALLFFAVICLPTLAYFLLAENMAAGTDSIVSGPVFCGYLLLLLVAGFYIALGLLISAAAPNQTVSAIICFSISSAIFFAGHFHYTGIDRTIQFVVETISGIQHVSDFTRGIIDSRVVLMYISGTVFLLFASIKTVESRHWK